MWRCSMLWQWNHMNCMNHTMLFLWIKHWTYVTLHLSFSHKMFPCSTFREHANIFSYITHPKFSSCSVRSANKPQWGRGIYFANISIKWSVTVRLGGRQGWEVRELPGCGQGASAFTFTLSAIPSGQEQGEFWDRVTKWSSYRSERAKESFFKV